MTGLNTIQEQLRRIEEQNRALWRVAEMQPLQLTKGTYHRHNDWRRGVRRVRQQATAILTGLSQTSPGSVTHWDVAVFCKSVGITRKSAQVRLLTHMQPTTGITQPGGPKALSEPWWEIEALPRFLTATISLPSRDSVMRYGPFFAA
jgi:hypothetical protein